MKQIRLVLMCIGMILLCSSFDPHFCEGRSDGLHASPDNRSEFYLCANQHTYRQFCPEGLVWDQTCFCCDYPDGGGGGHTGWAVEVPCICENGNVGYRYECTELNEGTMICQIDSPCYVENSNFQRCGE